MMRIRLFVYQESNNDLSKRKVYGEEIHMSNKISLTNGMANGMGAVKSRYPVIAFKDVHGCTRRVYLFFDDMLLEREENSSAVT